MCLAAKHELSHLSREQQKHGENVKNSIFMSLNWISIQTAFSLARTRFSAFFATDWRWRRARRFSISSRQNPPLENLPLPPQYFCPFSGHTHTQEYAGGRFVFLGFLAKLIAYGFVVSCHRHRFCCCRRKLKHKYIQAQQMPATHTQSQWFWPKVLFALTAFGFYGKNK